MLTPDFKQLLWDVEQCNAAYVPDELQARAAFRQLGYDFVGRFSDDNAQAVICRAQDQFDLVFAGTRVSDGTPMEVAGDLWRDLDWTPLELGGGLKVAAAPYQGARKVYQWALETVGQGVTLNVKGHSLGGWQATYAPLYMTPDRIGRIVAVSSPKQGNDMFWQHFEQLFDQCFTGLVDGADPFFGWPICDPKVLSHGDREHIWLHDSTYDIVTESQWPGGDAFFHRQDHSPSVLIDALRALANSSPD